MGKTTENWCGDVEMWTEEHHDSSAIVGQAVPDTRDCQAQPDLQLVAAHPTHDQPHPVGPFQRRERQALVPDPLLQENSRKHMESLSQRSSTETHPRFCALY